MTTQTVEGARIASVATALPDHYYGQDQLVDALKRHWARRHVNLGRLEAFHRNVQVGGRRLALPVEAYDALDGLGASNDAFLEVGTELACRVVSRLLDDVGLSPDDVDLLATTTVTGLAVPSLDARVCNRLAINRHVRRLPMFGLGCAAGAAGVARLADFLAAHPRGVALMVAVELCSLTLQREDVSIPNIVSSGLFGDGAAGVLMLGRELAAEHAARPEAPARPTVVDAASVFYPDTEQAMGWDVVDSGFKVVLSREVPDLVRANLQRDAAHLLERNGLSTGDLTALVCHPGGPKVLEALADALAIDPALLEPSWHVLRELGNMSSASVLFVLDRVMRTPPAPGGHAMMAALGPGFGSELVLLRW